MKHSLIFVLILISTFALLQFNLNFVAFAEREIIFEKTVNVKQEYLIQTLSDLKKYPKILPNNINSVQLIDGKENQALMNVGLEGINFDVKTKYTVLPDGNHFIEVLEGDLKGTKLTTSLERTWGFDGTKEGGTIVKMKLSLEISGALSLVTLFASDETILFALDSSLIKFVNHAKNEQLYVEKVLPSLQNWSEFEKISFWFKDFTPKNTVKFYLRGDRLGTSTPFVLETDSSEWKKFELPLSSFSKINLEKVRGISFSFGDNTLEQNFAVDEIVLSSKNKEKKLGDDSMTSLFTLRRSNSANSILIQDVEDAKVGKTSMKIQTTIIEGSTAILYDFAFPGKKSTIKELKPLSPKEEFDIDLLTILYIIAISAVVTIFVLYWKRKRQNVNKLRNLV